MTRPRTSGAARWLSGMSGLLQIVVAVMLVAMMLLTVVDVGGRYFFNRPLLGSFEITEMMLACLVFCTLPLVTLAHEHISVDLFEQAIPARWRKVRDVLVQLLCAVAMLFVARRLAPKAIDASEYGDTTASLLIPLAPMIWLMCVMCALTGLILIGQCLHTLITPAGDAPSSSPSQADTQ